VPALRRKREDVVSRKLDQATARFVRERPDCIRLLVRLARKELAEGERRLSMKALFEKARPKVRKAKPVKGRRVVSLNNSLTSRLARIFERTYPEMRGRFELRGLGT
jgi:hypothetical protein